MTTGPDIGERNRNAFHTSRPTKIATHSQGGNRRPPAGWLGSGGGWPFRGGDGGVGVLTGPLTVSERYAPSGAVALLTRAWGAWIDRKQRDPTGRRSGTLSPGGSDPQRRMATPTINRHAAEPPIPGA